MVDFVPSERGTPIRQPATANLMIDSDDRSLYLPIPGATPFDFQITRPQGTLNGFFTRIGTTEVVLDWNEPNGAFLSTLGPTQLAWLSSGVSSIVTIPNEFSGTDFYTAKQALDQFTASINNVSTLFPDPASAVDFFVDTSNAPVPLIVGQFGAEQWGLSTNQLTKALGLESYAPFATPAFYSTLSTSGLFSADIVAPDLRAIKYLDFTSQQLTYNQDLKDNSTAQYPKDVLCRWYMEWDNQPQRDAYGFPIEMGYEPFKLRRLFNPPKQIKWDTTQPLGNIAFQVFKDNGAAPLVPVAPPYINNTSWRMTLQVSET